MRVDRILERMTSGVFGTLFDAMGNALHYDPSTRSIWWIGVGPVFGASAQSLNLALILGFLVILFAALVVSETYRNQQGAR